MSKRQDYIKQLEGQAEKDYSTLELITPHNDHSRFVLKKPGTSIYYTELIPISGGLLIFGDVETSLFRYCSAKDALGKVSWVARGSLGYLAEKFTMGMNDDGKLRKRYDHAVALEDINNLYEQHVEEHEGCSDDIQDIFVEAKAKLNEYGPEGAELVLIRDYDFEITVGRVPATRLFYARAAARRVMQILT